eukprot:gnl/MRDRNA2_/MRDRNA2_86244_c0_seq1.p1 gnl/MRDRNA2_/MRDRNA2_86244_c0~~gnl/MRDRNA2_/MRDRNA2_86244_c0_seq1.p1  ORF type:complete len:387 (-),score=63.20 gnl/MRDRNA2_/MRDRNA2_86244_c0_seq1:68-1165(-)
MELVAVKEQPPIWFVSHWWGERFMDTVALLSWHSRCHNLPGDTAYWICTFANNQHNVLAELGGDVMGSSFVRAILSQDCKGTVLLLDPKVTPMKRVWCVLENYVSTIWCKNKRYDLCAIIPESVQFNDGEVVGSGPALMMDMGDGSTKELCEPEHGVFPFEVAEAGAQVDVALAEATSQEDRDRILHILAGSKDLSVAPPVVCDGYDRVNSAVRARYRGRAMYICAWRNDVSRLQKLLDVKGEDGEVGQLNDQSCTGATAVYIAAERNSFDCLCLLVKARADVNITTHDGISPIQIAAELKNRECIELLAAQGADVHSVDVADHIVRQTSECSAFSESSDPDDMNDIPGMPIIQRQTSLCIPRSP